MPPAPPAAPPTPRPLERGMGLAGVLFLTLSAATPASSFFVIVPDVLKQAGTGALWAMGAAALVAAAVAQVYAELASAFPYAGGEYAVVVRVLGPAPGFAMLAVNGLNCLLAAAVLSLGVAEQLAAAWPGAPAPPLALALGCLALSTALGVLDIRANAWITGAFLLVELAALAAVAALGAAQPARGLLPMLAHPVAPVAGGFAPVGWGGVALSTTVALFAYDGYGSAIYFAEELREPRRRVALAVTVAAVLVVAFEIVPLAAALTGAPDLRALLEGGIGGFVEARAGRAAAHALSAAVALAILNAVIAMVLLSSRQLYATARDGVWPGALGRRLAEVHPRWRSPWVATLAAGATAAALCLLPLRLLLVLTGTGVTAVYAGLSLALIVGRRTRRTARATHRTPFGPWLAGAALAVLLAVLLADAADPAEGRVSLCATGLIALAGAALGHRAGRHGGWRPTGPADDDA